MDLSHLQFTHSNISANLRQSLNCLALAKSVLDHDPLPVSVYDHDQLLVESLHSETSGGN